MDKENVIITVRRYVRIMFGSYVRLTLSSYIRLTLGSYVIKPCEWDQSIT